MDDKLQFTASEIDYDISKYFNSFGKLKVKDPNVLNQIDTMIDKNNHIMMVVGGEYVCKDSHTGDIVTEFIESVLHLNS